MSYRKKLIEVALLLDAINKESAREKSVRKGHILTLHLWWARRPLADRRPRAASPKAQPSPKSQKSVCVTGIP